MKYKLEIQKIKKLDKEYMIPLNFYTQMENTNR